MLPMIFSRTEQPGVIGTTRNVASRVGAGQAAQGRDRSVGAVLGKGKLSAGDVVIMSSPDVSRAVAQRLIDARVAAVVNTEAFTTGRVPNFGPRMLMDSGIQLVENAPADIVSKAKDGKKVRLHEGKLFYGERSIGGGHILTEDAWMGRFDEARGVLGDHMETLAGNTAEFVRSEAPLLIDGVGIPDVDVNMDDRKVLVVSPDPRLKHKLRELRYFLREYDPVIIAVDEAADVLIEGGHHPKLIVGDPERMSTAALRSGATVILPAAPDGYAPGLERIQDLGVGAMTFPAATRNSRDLALLLANYHGASMVVDLGESLDVDLLFQEANSPDMPSTLLSQLRVGPRLVSATAVAELYRVQKSGGGWLWALLGVLVALLTVLLIVGFSGDAGFVQNLIDTWNNVALSVQRQFSR